MSSDTGGKPPSGSSPGRPAADTPQRLVVRSLEPSGSESSVLGASDTAVAMATDSRVTPTGDDPSTPSSASSSELIGVTLSGRYLVTKKVGQGGMGAVYEATHTLIGKRVAVKVLLEKYAQREAIVARLKKEAQLASSIGNEHIIDITDIGNTEDGRTFVVMEYLEGESLAECLAREHELPEQRILRIASQAASALAAAHAKGIVHRDIKPENLFLLKRKGQDFVKVVDFGISKSLRASSDEEEAQRLTQTGMVLGTPLYMSPEQARGDEDLDHRVDIYALGVIMYETAAGRVPFAGTNYLSVISQVLNEVPKPLREIRPELSEEFEAIVSRAMEKDRTHRYADAQEMLKDVTLVLEDPTHSTERAKITGPRRRFPKPKIPRLAWAVGGIGIAVGAVTIAVVMLMGGSPKPPVKNLAAPPPVADAGVALVPVPDAAAVPQVEKIKLHIVTDPPHAALYRESEPIGDAPQDIELVMISKEVQITAVLDGYVDGIVHVNPEEHKDKNRRTIPIKLKRLPKGAPRPIHHLNGFPTGSGSATVPHGGTAGGEWGGYPGGEPGLGSGTLPRK
jgi:serine/threonine protein kinase